MNERLTVKAKYIEIEIKPIKGKDFKDVCGEIKELGEYLKTDITFEFNGVKINTSLSINEMVKRYNTAI